MVSKDIMLARNIFTPSYMLLLAILIACIGCEAQQTDHGTAPQKINTAPPKTQDSLQRTYWKSGTLSTEGFYKNGLANGLMKWYSEDGVLVAYGNMTDGKRDGQWHICDIHHVNTCIEASFKNDKKDGLWSTLYDDGSVHNEQQYDKGTLLSEQCWDTLHQRIPCGKQPMPWLPTY